MRGVPDIVMLDGGVHIISTPLIINHNNVIIRGSSDTIVRIADGTTEGNYGAFAVTGFDNIAISNIEIDGNKGGQGAYVATPGLIEATGITGLTVSGCEVYDSKGDGVEPVSCEGVEIYDCYVHDCYQHAVHLNGVTNGLVADCHLADDGSLLIAMGHGGCDTVTIRDNLIERPGGTAPAIGVSANDAPAGMRRNCTITGNTIDMNGTNEGILIAEGFDNCEIAGNTFVDGPAIMITVGSGAINIDIDANAGLSPDNIEWL